MSLSLLVLAKESGLKRVDEVVLNRETPTQNAGTTAFVVEGSRSDPGMLRAAMPVDLAIRTPVADSQQKLELVNQQLAVQAATQQENLSRRMGDAANGAPKISM